MKEHHVTVHFEREDIDSDDEQCDLIVNFLAAVAQEESNSISQAMIWANNRNNRIGNPTVKCPYGFRKKPRAKRTDPHEWQIFEPEAKIVRFAFELAKQNYSYRRITEKIRELQKEIPEVKPRKWSGNCVERLLRNEAYMGDCCPAN